MWGGGGKLRKRKILKWKSNLMIPLMEANKENEVFWWNKIRTRLGRYEEIVNTRFIWLVPKLMDRPISICSPNYFILNDLNRGIKIPVFSKVLSPNNCTDFKFSFTKILDFQNILFRWVGQWIVPTPVHRTDKLETGELLLYDAFKWTICRIIVWSLFDVSFTIVNWNSSQETYTAKLYLHIIITSKRSLARNLDRS